MTAEKEGSREPPPLGERFVRWRGAVPPQKWMNFYAKVLSKYATMPDLRFEVSFEVKVDREQAKAAETKSSLRELGLDDIFGIGLSSIRWTWLFMVRHEVDCGH